MRIALAVLASLVVATPALALTDKTFLDRAIRDDNAAIALTHLAGARGASAQARRVAREIEGDRSRDRMRAVQLADGLGLTAPKAGEAQDAARVRRLGGLTGAAFDKAFVRDALADNVRELKLYQREAGTGIGQVARYAELAIPTLKRNLRLAEYLSYSDQVVGSR